MDTHTDTTNLECDAISVDTTEITIKEIPEDVSILTSISCTSIYVGLYNYRLHLFFSVDQCKNYV